MFADEAETKTIEGVKGEYSPTDVPIREGYIFTGWNETDSAISGEPTVTVDHDVTLYAIWIEQTYTVILNANNGVFADETETKTIEDVKGEYSPVDVPIREGYIFTGWNETDSAISGEPTVTVDRDVTLYAVWVEQTYTVTLNANNGMFADEAETKTIEDVKGEYSPMDVPIREGYIFVGWNKSDDATTGNATVIVDQDVTLYAIWIEQTYTVILSANNGMFADETETKTIESVKGEYSPTDVPVREGYVFVGWNETDDATTGNATVIVDHDVTLYAVWIEQTYTVTLDANNGAFADETETKTIEGVKGEYSPGDVPAREGYVFVGWNESDDATTGNATVIVDRDVTLYAVWIEQTYTVTLNANNGMFADGTETKTIEGIKGEYSPTELSEREGYIFLGWSLATDGNTQDVFTITMDTTLYAIWQERTVLPSLTITGTDGNVTANQRITLTGQLIDADGNAMSDAYYTWYEATTNGRIEMILDTPYWIELGDGEISFVATSPMTLICVGTNGNVTAEASITFHVTEDTNAMSPWIEVEQTDFMTSMTDPSAFAHMTCMNNVALEDAIYRWEYYIEGDATDTYPWMQSPDEDGSSELYTDLGIMAMALNQAVYEFRCTVEIVRNGISYEYVTNTQPIYVTYDEMGGECFCGCGMPGCTCGTECPMMGGGDGEMDDPWMP